MASCAVRFEHQQSVLATPAWIIYLILLDIDGQRFVAYDPIRSYPFVWAECSRWTSADGGARGHSAARRVLTVVQLWVICNIFTSLARRELHNACWAPQVCSASADPVGTTLYVALATTALYSGGPDVPPSVRNFFPFCSVTFLQNLGSKELIFLGGYPVSTGKWPTDILLVWLALMMNALRVFETPVPSRYGVTSQKTWNFISVAVSASVKLSCIRPALA